MKNFSKIVVAALMALGLITSACDKRADVTRDSLTFEGINSEEVLSGDDTKELSKLVGNLTFGQVLDLLGNSLKTLNALAEQGYTTKEDYQTLLNIIKNTHTYLLEQKAEYDKDPHTYESTHSDSSKSMSDLLKIAVDAKVGLLLNQVIKQAGSQCLTENIYPMIAYAINADDDILNNIINGGTSSTTVVDITHIDFDSLLDLTNKLVKNDNISAFRSALETEPITQNTVTVDDIKSLYNSLITLAGPYTPPNSTAAEETPAGPYTDDQSKKIWDKAGEVLKNILKSNSDVHENIKDSSKALSLYITSDDFKATLDGLENVLAINPDTLKSFVAKALSGIAQSSGSEYMSYIAHYLAGINNDDIDGIAKGLAGAFGTDWYYKSGPNALSNVKTSGLRALMFMMQEAGNSNNVLNKLGIINLMSSTDDSKYGWIPSNWYTNNVAEWTIGEVVHAVNKFGPFKGIDYVLYEKPYDLAAFSVAGIPIKPKSYTGMNAMMTDTMMDLFRENSLIMIALKVLNKDIQSVDGILDPFPAFKELAGGDGKTSGTAGTRHKLISLFAPLMQSAWQYDVDNFEQKNQMPMTFGTVDMMAQLNEITHDYYIKKHTLKDSNPAFVQDDQSVVFGNVETALKSALKDRSSTGNTDPGLVAPILKLAITVLKGLNDTDCPVIKDQKLLVSIIKDLNMQVMTSKDQGELIAKLFSDLNEKNQKTLVANLSLFLTETKETGRTNSDNIVELARVMGDAMIKSDVVGSLVGLLPDAVDAVSVISKMIPASTGTDDTATTKELMDYLTAKINGGEENPFIVNGWKLVYKALDVWDKDYNPASFIYGTTTITGPEGLLTNLRDLYSVKKYIFFDAEPLTKFLLDATDATGKQEGRKALWSIFNSTFNSSESVGMLKKIMGGDGAGENYIKISIEPGFIRALFTSIDNNGDGTKEDAVALSILKQINLNYVNDDREFMQRILGEVMELTSSTEDTEASIFDPGTEKFDNLILTLDNLLKNISVK